MYLRLAVDLSSLLHFTLLPFWIPWDTGCYYCHCHNFHRRSSPQICQHNFVISLPLCLTCKCLALASLAVSFLVSSTSWFSDDFSICVPRVPKTKQNIYNSNEKKICCGCNPFRCGHK